MEKYELGILDKILSNVYKKDNMKEEALIYLIRSFVLEKYGIKSDSYIKFLNKNFGDCDEVIIEDISVGALSGKFMEKFDLLTLCSILEEYMNNKKRELTGSYYTPAYIIKFMISNSIKLYLEEAINIDGESLEKLISDEVIFNINNRQLKEILELLSSLKVIDIACGSGLFLHYTLEKIYRTKVLIYRTLNLEFEEYGERKWILENNIFGVDIQKVPLEMAVLKYIDMLSAFKGFNLDSLRLNFYQRNSILGDQVFSVEKISEVVQERGFDIVIGNPPYIGEKGNKDIFENIKKYEFGKKYYEGKMDYFYYFIYRGIDILKDNGILSYITTNYFITADGARKLRKFFKDKVSFKNIINFNEYEIFKSAKGQHNIIFTVTKGVKEDKNINIKYIKNRKLKTDHIIEIINNEKLSNNISSYTLNKQESLYGIDGNIMIFPNEKYCQILKKIKSCCSLTLGDLCNINQGIVSGADKVTNIMLERKLTEQNIERNNIKIDEGIFVLNKEELIDANIKNCRALKPFYKNSDINKYLTNNSTDKFILYITDRNILNTEYCFVIQNHLKKYREVLNLRRETKKGMRNWFALQWSRDQSIFEGAKIVVPHRALDNKFGYNNDLWYASADVYFITGKKEDVDLILLLGILNSKITYFWLYNMGKRKGDYLELYSSPLSQIPINLNFNEAVKKDILKIANEILSCCKNNCDSKLIKKYQDKIDRYLYKAFEFNEEEIKEIRDLYDLKLNR